MSSQIQRLLYYDRELLRGFDFTDEQNYHLEMRRRLNLALHLTGIASGLELMAIADTGDQYCVNPGMAIDGYGREIVLFDRYVLSDLDFQTAHIKVGGSYAVCISYDRTPATPPSAGYNNCGSTGEYTRWVEVPKIQLLDNLPDPGDSKQPTDPLPDDPSTSPWPVFLGWIKASVSGAGAVSVSKITTGRGQRQYVGVSAQRLRAPSAPPPSAGANPDPAVYIDADLPIMVLSDMQEQKNLIVGDENILKIDVPKVVVPTGQPALAADFPGPAGNLKVENNLFVLGELYRAVNDKWYPLSEYIRTIIPEMKVGTKSVPVDVAGLADPTVKFSLATDKLPSISGATIVASLSAIEWQSLTDLKTWSASTTSTDTIKVGVEGAAVGRTAGGAMNSWDFKVIWQVGPKSAAIPETLDVKSLTISYVVIFYP